MVSPVRNRLLASLDPEAVARVWRHLTSVHLRAKEVLYRPGEPIKEVYFPEDMVIVQLATDVEGRSIETATVGNEGASWISASASAPSMPCETLVAIEGRALKIDVKDLDTELRENPQLQTTFTRYSHALLVASMRTTGCTGLHDVSQRCARWMLQTLDRVSSDRFAVTQEFLASLMGTRRATITIAIAAFEQAGYVETTRGLIRVKDREGLKAASCECYEIIRAHYEEARLSPRQH